MVDKLGRVDLVDALIAVVMMKPPEFAAKKCLKIWFLTSAIGSRKYTY